jgi:hypothetical protein
LVSGASAHALDRVLASPNVAKVIENLPGWLRDEVTATARAIRRAAPESQSPPMFVSGNAERR